LAKRNATPLSPNRWQVRRDERLAGQLAGAIGGDGEQRAERLVELAGALVAVDATARRVDSVATVDRRHASTVFCTT
jgi:hypothetical protein